MLLTPPGREEAIHNIIRAVGEGRFHDKTEPFDPVLSPEELSERIRDHIQRMHSPASKLKNLIARGIAEIWRRRYSVGTDRIEGAEKLEGIRGGAFLTSNHFNPFDNGVIRTLSRETGHGRLWALSQGTNFVMPGLNGFMLRHSDVIPLLRDPSYMAGPLREMMRKVLDKKHFILIYPEQEMWFNYRKPRPGKRGAYLFAADRDNHINNPEYGIKAHIAEDEIVISDRYFFSSFAYQSIGFDGETVKMLNSRFPYPEYVLYVDTPVEDCISRIEGRVLGDPRFFSESTPQNLGWTYDDLGTNYGAGPLGLNFFENAQNFYVTPGPSVG